MEKAIEILIFLGAGQGLLMSFFLISLKLNRVSNKILAALTFLWGVFLLFYGLQSEGFYVKYPHFLKVMYQLLFLFFPLLYLYVKYLLSDIPKFEKKDYIHFIPFVISLILYLPFFIQSGDDKLYLIRNKTEYYRVLQVIGDEFIMLQGFLYSIWALILISKYKKQVTNFISNIDKKIIKALYIGISLNLLSWTIGGISLQLEYMHVNMNFNILYGLTYLVMVIVIYAISFIALRSPEIFKLDKKNISIRLNEKNEGFDYSPVYNDSKIRAASAENSVKKDKSSKEQEEEFLAINKKLIEIMETEKPYLDPDLSLPELAKKLNVSRNHLSNVINQVHHINFYKFVNKYRVEEVKRLMRDPSNKHIKLLSLAYDAGFNSKASFNRIFKQMTNMTPSEYFEKHRKEKQEQ